MAVGGKMERDKTRKGKSVGWAGREETMAVDTRRVILMAVFTIEEPQEWKQTAVWSGAKSTLLWLVWIISDAKVTVNGDLLVEERSSFLSCLLFDLSSTFSPSFPFFFPLARFGRCSKMNKYGGLRHPCPNKDASITVVTVINISLNDGFSFYSRGDESRVCVKIWNSFEMSH